MPSFPDPFAEELELRNRIWVRRLRSELLRVRARRAVDESRARRDATRRFIATARVMARRARWLRTTARPLPSVVAGTAFRRGGTR